MKNKTEALQRLTEIEKETKHLRQIIEESEKPKTITERVTDISSAILELGEGDEDVIIYRKMQKSDMPRKILSSQEIAIFCKAVNEGTKMDLSNDNQQKWAIWFDGRKKVGSGFVYYFDYCYYSSLSFSARHLYKTRALAEHGAKCIEKIYYEYIME